LDRIHLVQQNLRDFLLQYRLDDDHIHEFRKCEDYLDRIHLVQQDLLRDFLLQYRLDDDNQFRECEVREVRSDRHDHVNGDDDHYYVRGSHDRDDRVYHDLFHFHIHPFILINKQI